MSATSNDTPTPVVGGPAAERRSVGQPTQGETDDGKTVHRWTREVRASISITSRLGASKMFTEITLEVAPVNPDLGQLAWVATGRQRRTASCA